MRNREHGLTSVETVIVILALVFVLLLALPVLLPIFTHHGEPAYRAKCLNNIKQIGTGLALYSSDSYFGIMPTRGPKHDLYVSGIISDEKVFECPMAPAHHVNGNYLRDEYWNIKRKRPNTVIVGDHKNNHDDDFITFLFKDGHASFHQYDHASMSPVIGVKDAYYQDDCMYLDDYPKGDTVEERQRRTWLHARE